jgi:hypothetical protein
MEFTCFGEGEDGVGLGEVELMGEGVVVVVVVEDAVVVRE